jgi:hypothetical protein
MKTESKQFNQTLEEIANDCATTAMGFQKEGLYFADLKKAGSTSPDGVLIGIHYQKCNPKFKTQLRELVELIAEISKTA